MNKLLNWYSSLSNSIKVITIFSITVVIVFIVFIIVTINMNYKAKELMQPYFTSDSIFEKHLSSMKKPPHLSTGHFESIMMEQKIMNIRKKHHYDLSVTLFRNYYGVLIVSMLLSCIGGVTLFIMINKGWANAGITLQSFFLALVISFTFFGFFPLVFQQEKNLNENMASYMNYSKAEMNILHQLAYLNNPVNSRILIKDSTTETIINRIDTIGFNNAADSIIKYNVTRINELMNYVLNINSKEIKSMSDVARLLRTDSL